MEEPLYLSQSMYKDWTSMCKLAFSKKWFGTEEEKALFSIDDKEVVRYGVHFESLVVGTGMGGKTIEWTEKERKSVFYERIKEQAKKCRAYLKHLGGRVVESQQEIRGSYEHAGATIYIKGNLDINYEFNDGRAAVIDLKTSSDLEATFGPFQWGDLDRVSTVQLVHYAFLYFLKYGRMPDETMYLVFDLKQDMRFSPISVVISEWAIDDHKEEFARVYSEIEQAMMMDYFEPNNSYKNCKDCPLKDTCKHYNPFPEPKIIEL